MKLAPEAQQLADAAEALAPQVATLREQRAYGEALAAIATLRPAVDAFFDKVMVLDPDAAVRGAHLGLIDEVLRKLLRHRGFQRDRDGVRDCKSLYSALASLGVARWGTRPDR